MDPGGVIYSFFCLITKYLDPPLKRLDLALSFVVYVNEPLLCCAIFHVVFA